MDHQREASVFAYDKTWNPNDSTLLEQWSDILSDYTKYRNMAARGEKAAVPAKEAPTTKSLPTVPTIPINPDPSLSDAAHSQAPPAAGPPGLAGMAQSILGNASNEDMKRLLMSWYYAGYYTGLSEGKQVAWAEMEAAEAAEAAYEADEPERPDGTGEAAEVVGTG